MNTTTHTNSPALVPRIEGRIQVIRGLRVMIDADLAELYGVPTKVLNQAVKRNGGRFPPDFMFQLDASEKTEVVTNCDHLRKLKFSKSLPFAFTEYGAVALANVLASAQAVEMGIYVVRAFVQLREAMSTNTDIAKRLAELEMKTESLELSHDTFSRNTRLQLRQLLDAVRELTTPPESPKRPIGFVALEDKKDKPSNPDSSKAKAAGKKT
ncbi:MAG: ORF6N domain-containing protein [Rhodoferax sp.]|nr:ORF6N domain-containing protein [Rhodoferax sp.]